MDTNIDTDNDNDTDIDTDTDTEVLCQKTYRNLRNIKLLTPYNNTNINNKLSAHIQYT